MQTLYVALLGSLVASCAYAAVLFLRFWHRSRDRFHLFMVASMVLLAANWVAVMSIRLSSEAHSEIYLVRLAAFLVILVGIIDRNRRG